MTPPSEHSSGIYESCVVDDDGRCKRWSHDHSAEERDACPMGCGRTTEDPYGGPCETCWRAVDEQERRS